MLLTLLTLINPIILCGGRQLRQERATLKASLERLNADIAGEEDRMRRFKDMMAEHLQIETCTSQQALQSAKSAQVDILASSPHCGLILNVCWSWCVTQPGYSLNTCYDLHDILRIPATAQQQLLN